MNTLMHLRKYASFSLVCQSLFPLPLGTHVAEADLHARLGIIFACRGHNIEAYALAEEGQLARVLE